MTPDLSQLRDIHLPAPISWWPLAPGWWLLGGLLLASALAGGWYVFRGRHYRQWRQQALKELAQLRLSSASPQASVVALSVLLRRVAISRFPRQQVAMLNGNAWLAFLDSKLGSAAFDTEAGRLLATAPYAKEANIDSHDLQALCDLGERWIKKLPRRRAQ